MAYWVRLPLHDLLLPFNGVIYTYLSMSRITWYICGSLAFWRGVLGCAWQSPANGLGFGCSSWFMLAGASVFFVSLYLVGRLSFRCSTGEGHHDMYESNESVVLIVRSVFSESSWCRCDEYTPYIMFYGLKFG
jgi:hypothetical protein